MVFQPQAVVIALPPIFAVFYLAWKVRSRSSRTRDPFRDPLLRPPGESCRQKLTALYEDLAFRVLWLVAPVICATSLIYTALSGGSYAVLLIISIVLTYVTVIVGFIKQRPQSVLPEQLIARISFLLEERNTIAKADA